MKRIKIFVLIFAFLASIIPFASAQETAVLVAQTHLMVTTSGNFNMDAGAPNKCSIANSAVINAGSTSGSCF